MTCKVPSHTHTTPYDPSCKREAKDIPSVVQFAQENAMTPEEFIKAEEGTYNPVTGHFLCDPCFLVEESMHAGLRLTGPDNTRWVCP